MKLVHSPHTSLKRLAAMNIAKFFKAFPDLTLDEDAINGIYVLCEDHDPDVRHSVFPLLASSPRCELKDTKAIVRISEEQPRWVEGREERGRLGAVTSERCVPHSPRFLFPS
jgi:hypothetical protein